jgi:hypothetical protein
MQSIITRFVASTNTKGSRIIASTSAKRERLSIPYDHAISPDKNHRAAARALAEKLDWQFRFVEGSNGESGNVYVIDRDEGFTIPKREAA